MGIVCVVSTQDAHEGGREGEAQRTGRELQVNKYIQRHYSEIVGRRRINAPTFDEVRKDLAQAYAPVFEA